MFAFSNTCDDTISAIALAALAALATLSGVSAAGRCELAQPCVLSEPSSKAIWVDAASGAASGRPCERVPAYVRGVGSNHEAACAAAGKALTAFAKCGIRPATTLYIQVTEAVRGPNGETIFGRYDPANDTIFVTAIESTAQLAADTPFERLPARDFFESLVVHETVHAIMGHNMLVPARTRSALEYPAFALQIDALPETLRDTLLNEVGGNESGTADIFSDAILMLDPYYFAARAYRHFKGADGGCKSLGALITGRPAFIAEQ